MKTNKLSIFAISLMLMIMGAGTAVAPATVPDVDIDVKPGSFPNSINLRSNGLVSVAILTTLDFDATTVDPETVRFGPTPSPVYAEPLRWAIEDVDGDGDMDLVFKFKIQETGIVAGNTEATLTGNLLAEYGGSPIEGFDSIRTIPSTP